MTPTNGSRPFRQPTSAPPAPPSQTATLTALLDATGRGVVPIRRVFVQQGHGSTTKPGPLAGLLTAHDERGLDAYLLVHALASAAPFTCSLPAAVWARALGVEGLKAASTVGAISKIMRRLDEDHGLIARGRARRRAVAILLREDGSRANYDDHPSKTSDRYLRLPDTYWREGWMDRLSLVGKTMLLIALERPDGFEMPFERAAGWYGISADSVERGLRELHSNDVLDVHHAWVPDARSLTGWSSNYTYTLTGAFSKAARDIASGRRASAAHTQTPADTNLLTGSVEGADQAAIDSFLGGVAAK